MSSRRKLVRPIARTKRLGLVFVTFPKGGRSDSRYAFQNGSGPLFPSRAQLRSYIALREGIVIAAKGAVEDPDDWSWPNIRPITATDT